MTIRYVGVRMGMLLLIAIVTWLTFSYPSRMHINNPQLSLLPDAYMEDVTAIIMDKQGKPSMKIVTPKMVHYTENDTSHLTAPELTIYRKSLQPWLVMSKYGKTSQGIQQVDFWDDVVVHHIADLSSPTTTIKTTTLTIHPMLQTAETNQQITLIQPNIIVNANGMLANMDSGDIKLLSDARGEYVPHS